MSDNLRKYFNCNFNAKEKIFEGNKTEPPFEPSLSVGQVLFASLQQNCENILQIDDTYHISVTNAQALKWGIRIALRLKEMAFDHTDIIGISAKNSTYLLPVVLGCFFNGTPFHAVNPDLDEETVTHCYGLTKPKLVFCDGEVYRKVKHTTNDICQSIVTLTEHLEGIPNVNELLQPVAGEQDYKPTPLVEGLQQTVAILCSSGTTGKPKAVRIAKSGVLIENVITYAFVSALHVAMLVAHPNVSRRNLGSLKIINFGGSNLSEATLLRVNDLLPEDVSINFTYGITEVGPISFNFDRTHPKSVGKLIPNLSIKIINEQNESLGVNGVGEVLIKTVHPWQGYYNNPAETAKAIDSDFWFHTGDLGYFDENLLLYLVDRKRETCKYQGIQYSPNEIQFTISELPDVKDVCVVAYEDDIDGDLAGALVVKAENSALTSEHIVDHVKKRLVADYKQLHAGAYFVEKLPYNSNNKCIRNKAQQMLRDLMENKINNNID